MKRVFLAGTAFALSSLVLLSTIYAADANAAPRKKIHEGSVKRSELQGSGEFNEAAHSVIGIRFIRYGYHRYADEDPGGDIIITRVVKRGPADITGLKKGDHILALNGVQTKTMPYRDFAHMLYQADPGTKLVFSVKRGEETLDVTVVTGDLDGLPDSEFRAALLRQRQDFVQEKRLEKALLMATEGASTRTLSSAPGADKVPIKERIKAVTETHNAIFLYEQKDFAQAAKKLQKALQFDSEFLEARYFYGLLLDRTGQSADAADQLAKCVEAKPDLIDAWCALGLCQQKQGQLAESIKSFKKYVSLSDDAKNVADVRRIIVDLQEQIAKGTTQPAAPAAAVDYVRQAKTLMDQNDYPGAAKKLLEAVNLDESFEMAWQALGICYMKMGNEVEATKSFKQFLKLSGENSEFAPWAWQALGAAQEKSGNSREAEIAFQKFIQLAPKGADVAWAWQGLASSRKNQGDFAGAVEAVNKYIELSPKSPDLPSMWQFIGGCQMKLGKLPEAIEAYRSCIRLAPESPEAAELKTLVMGLQDELEKSPVRVSADEEDYLKETIQKYFHRWGVKRAPIRVFIEDGKGLSAYIPDFDAKVRQAFTEWEECAGGVVKFKFVDKEKTAEITVKFSDDPMELNSLMKGGQTQLTAPFDKIEKAKITLLTVRGEKRLPVNADTMHGVALHEIGHALGLTGHSSCPKDIMFMAGNPEGTLTERDKKTLLALYAAKKPKGMPSNTKWDFRRY